MDVRSKILETMLELIVIKDAREACYIFDDLHNMFQEEFWGKCNQIQTGSFAEGVINYNDLDMMHVSDDLVVVTTEKGIPLDYKYGVLMLDPTDCSPGYTKLLLLRDIPDNKFDVYTRCNGKQYLNSSKFTRIKFTNRELVTNIDAHGPAIMTSGGIRSDVDLVECFKCISWPSFARKIQLTKYSNNCDMVLHNCKIMENGCHVVAVAHHNSKNPELEFRMSFSLAEKYLIRNWSDKQLKLYYIAKALFKKYFQVDSFLQKGLCSYFAKTVIYWLDEKYLNTYWEETSLLGLIHQLFETLKKYVKEKSMPNYFISEYYMFGSFTDQQLNDILLRLEEVSLDYFLCILHCDIIEYEGADMLLSIYEIVQSMGDDSMMKNILQSISESDFLNEGDMRFVPHGGRRAWHCYTITHLYIENFSRFCSHQFNVSIALHRSKEFQNVWKRLQELTHNPTLLQAAKVIIDRCLGVIALSMLFNLKEKDENLKSVLLQDVESLFASSVHFPTQLNDGGIVGSVYLGMFFYLTGQTHKSQEVLSLTAKTAMQQIKQGVWHRLSQMICIHTEKDRLLHCPRFFSKEDTLCELFEKRHIHINVEFDPLVLCSYLLCRINEEYRDIFGFACSEEVLQTRKNKEVSYMRYKLGLLEPNCEEFMECSKVIHCEICEYVKNIKKTQPLNLPQIPL